MQIRVSDAESEGLLSQKILLVDVKQNPNFRNDRNAPYSVASAALYERGNKTPVRQWPVLYDFLQVRKGEVPAQYLRASSEHVQIANVQPDGLLEVTTLDKNFKVTATHKDVVVVRQRPDQPPAHHFRSYSYRHPLDQVDYAITTLDERLDTSIFSYSLLVAHPTQKDWFVFLEKNGQEALPQDAVGVVPLLVDEKSFSNYFHRCYDKDFREFKMAHGWMIAYLNPQNKLVWGWGSPQLGWVSGPLWNDFYLHARTCVVGDRRVSSVGCGFYHHLTANENYTLLTGKRDPTSYSPFVRGPFIVAQHFDGSWQAYTQQVYLFDTPQKNLATYNQPNTFSGLIPKAKTDKEAIAAAEAWIKGYEGQLSARVQSRYDVVAKHNDILWKQKLDKAVEAKMKENEAAAVAHWKNQMRVEERRAQEGSEARARTLNEARSSSFTNRLRNMSGAGASSRATESLRSNTNQLYQKQGKGYKSR